MVSADLERSRDGDVDVVGLVLRQGGEDHAKVAEVELRDLLVEDLGEHGHAALGVLARLALLPELDLREGLVGEGVGHDEGGVARGAAEVEEAALRQHDDAVAIRVDKAVNLRLDVLDLDDVAPLASLACSPS